MPDVLLFGATGYTGRLTAHALARRGASFAVCGRDRAKLEDLARQTGNPDVRMAAVGDAEALTRVLEDVRVLVTCVGPFIKLGDTAAEAALRAGVHYIDSTGEQDFVGRLIARCDGEARTKGIAFAPCLGFDEVPSDAAATLATLDMDAADLVLTYAVRGLGSAGTRRSTLDIITRKGPWLREGRVELIRAGQKTRWAPLPPPLGPRQTIAFPFSEGRLAPLHLHLDSLELYLTTGTAERIALRFASPALAPILRMGIGQTALEKLLPSGSGPTDEQRTRSKWTILAEARSDTRWRNVVLMGTDPYGLTAEFLAAGALRMCEADFDAAGVVAPVQVFGLETIEKLFAELGVSVEIYEPKS